MPRQQPAVESIEPVDTLPKISNTTKNSPEAKRTIEKTKERLTPLKAEKISIDIFKTAELDYDKSFLLVAKKLGLKNHNVYDLKFQQKLIERQKELGLKPDGILGVVTLSSILLEDIISKGGDVFIKLSTNKELKKFNKDIEKGTVTDEQLKKYENQLKGKFDLFLEGVEKKNLGKANNFLTKNYTTIQILYLMAKFNNQNKNNPKYKAHFNRMNEFKKEYKNNPTINKILNNPMTVMSSLKISPEQAKRLGITLSQDGTIAPAEHQKGGNLISVMLDKNKTWSEKLQALSGSALGWLGIIILVWNKFGFKGVMIGIAGLVAGAADGITPKSLAKMLGEQLDKGISEDSKAKGAAAVAATTEALTKVSNKVKESGVNLVDYTKNLFTKNNNIVETAMSENNKLDKNKLMTISKELGGDDKFKEIKIEKLSSLKYNDLDKTTKKILKEKGIEGDTKEFKAYVKTLKEKIVEARKKDKSIQTVGDYFDKWNIDGNDIGFAAGVGFMTWGLLSKSPTKFFLGVVAVAESTTQFIQDFFKDGKGKEYVKKAKEITGIYWNNIELKLDTLKIDKTTKETILKGLHQNNFPGLRTVYNDKPEIIKFINFAEEQYYTGEVEAKTGTNNYIPDFADNLYDKLKSKGMEWSDSFDENIGKVRKSIDELQKLRDSIPNTVSNKNLLIAKLNAEIAKSKEQIRIIEAKKAKYKLENKNKLEKGLNKLEEDFKTKIKSISNLNNTEIENILNKIKNGDNKSIRELINSNFKNNIDEIKKDETILELENLRGKIKQKQAELKKATAIVSKIQTEQIEKKENITRLENSVKNIKDFSTKNLDEIYSNISTLKSDIEIIKKTKTDYKGQNTDIKNLISKGEENIKNFKKHINSFANTILGEIKADNLSNYPDEEISKYKKILEKLDIKSDDFITALKTKKKEIFNVKISSANIEEIQILRKNFKNAGIENFENKIEGRLKELAENTLVKEDKKLVEIINKLDDVIKSKIDVNQNIYKLYKISKDSELTKGITKYIENKYGKIKIKETNSQTITSNKISVNTNPRANRGKETKKQKQIIEEQTTEKEELEINIPSPSDLFDKE